MRVEQSVEKLAEVERAGSVIATKAAYSNFRVLSSEYFRID